jgi:PAS domain S-box-containing protein
MNADQNQLKSYGIMVADHVSAMLAYWDKDLVCRFANAAYLDWFGKSREEMINKMTMKELLGGLFELNLPYINGVLTGEAQTFERDIPIPAGGMRHSLANYYPDMQDGEVKGFFVHVADVSPLKALEKKLIESNQVIKDQNSRLINFANIVSHNLKSYANNIASILGLYESAGSDGERNEMIGYLKDISKGFTSTINDINKIVRLQNEVNIELEPVNVYAAVEMALQVVEIEIKFNNAVINNTVDKEVSVLVNPAYIESILLNFLTNAIKYKHPDRSPVIEISSYVENDKTVIAIKDNGVGINLEKHGSSLFGMYKTFHGNTNAEGVGLFITKYQVEKMGGRVKVESEENVGSIFSIYVQSA